MSSAAWFDGRGCLSTAGVAALRGAPPGGSPDELARHVATCARCQARLLAVEAAPREPQAKKPRPVRSVVLFALALTLLLLFMVTTVWLMRP